MHLELTRRRLIFPLLPAGLASWRGGRWRQLGRIGQFIVVVGFTRPFLVDPGVALRDLTAPKACT